MDSIDWSNISIGLHPIWFNRASFCRCKRWWTTLRSLIHRVQVYRCSTGLPSFFGMFTCAGNREEIDRRSLGSRNWCSFSRTSRVLVPLAMISNRDAFINQSVQSFVRSTIPLSLFSCCLPAFGSMRRFFHFWTDRRWMLIDGSSERWFSRTDDVPIWDRANPIHLFGQHTISFDWEDPNWTRRSKLIESDVGESCDASIEGDRLPIIRLDTVELCMKFMRISFVTSVTISCNIS